MSGIDLDNKDGYILIHNSSLTTDDVNQIYMQTPEYSRYMDGTVTLG